MRLGRLLGGPRGAAAGVSPHLSSKMASHPADPCASAGSCDASMFSDWSSFATCTATTGAGFSALHPCRLPPALRLRRCCARQATTSSWEEAIQASVETRCSWPQQEQLMASAAGRTRGAGWAGRAVGPGGEGVRQLRGGAAAGLCIRVGVAAGAVDVAAHDGGAVPHPEGLSRPQPHPRRPLRHEFGARLPALHECLRKRATEIQGPQLRVRPELERGLGDRGCTRLNRSIIAETQTELVQKEEQKHTCRCSGRKRCDSLSTLLQGSSSAAFEPRIYQTM